MLKTIVAIEQAGPSGDDQQIGLRAHRLLIVVNDLRFFLSHRLSIAERARERGFDVIVATPPSDASTRRLIEAGIKHRTINLHRWSMNPFLEISALLDLCRLYREVKPDVVHHVTIKPVIYGTLAARMTSVPAVANAISGLGYMFSEKGRLGKFRRIATEFLYRVALKHKNQITIFQNSYDLALFKKRILASDEAVVMIPGSGINLGEFLPARPAADSTPVVMMVARLVYDKGVVDFVEAARLLRGRGVDARFVLVGAAVPENPDGVEVGLLQRWEREGVVELWGYQDDIRRCLNQASIVCLPTCYQEGLPRILLEASACALPIVTTPVAGCLEIVRDGVNGVLVPKRDPKTLSSAVQHLLSDPDLRRTLGDRARLLLEEGSFTQLGVADRTIEAYRDALAT